MGKYYALMVAIMGIGLVIALVPEIVHREEQHYLHKDNVFFDFSAIKRIK